MPGSIPFSTETQDGPEQAPGPASGEGRTPPGVYKRRIRVAVTVLREVQMGKGADDHVYREPRRP